MKRVRLGLCVAAVVVVVPAAAQPASDASITVAATGSVGTLHVDRSRPAEIRRLAGPPSFHGRGRTRLGPAFEALGYSCSRHWADTQGINPGGARRTHVWCRTVYFVSLETHRFASFWTDSPTFQTVNGSHPGMPQRIADRLERRHAYAHALTGINYSTRSADLFIENIGCKATQPGDPERTPCVGGHIRSLIVEGHHRVGLLSDAFPSWDR